MVDEVRPAYADDEIDLFELIETLWKEKLWIIFFTVISTAGGLGYAFLAKPVYEASVQLLPPANKDVAELDKLGGVTYAMNANANANAIRIPGVGAVGAFEAVTVALQSSALKREFLQLPDVAAQFNPENLPLAQVWKGYDESISVTLPAKSTITTSVKVTLDNAAAAADMANRYAQMAVETARAQLVSDFEESLSQQLERVEATIENRKTTFDAQIDVELAKLREARGIAATVGLERESVGAVIVDGRETMMVDELRRLYRKGTVAIDAEIQALEGRKKQAALVPGLLDLQQQRAYLAAVSIDASRLVPAIIDMPALEPTSPIKPKKTLIVALALVLGGMVGVMFVLIRSAVRKRKATA